MTAPANPRHGLGALPGTRPRGWRPGVAPPSAAVRRDRPPADDAVLRAATITVGAAAVLGLAAARLVPGWLAVLDAVAVAGCSTLARLAVRVPVARRWRLAAWLVVAAVTVWIVTVGPVRGDPPLVLGTLVAGFVAATAADQDGSRRAMLVNLALALAVLTLAAGVAPRPALTLPVLVGWGAGLVVLARADRQAHRHAADALPPAPPGRGRRTARLLAVPIVLSMLASAVVFTLVQLGHPDPQQAGGVAAPWGAGGPGTPDRRSPGSYAGEEMDLRARGSLPATPALQVPAGSATLWRSGWLDTYTGSGWELSQPTFVRRLGGGSVDLGQDPTDPVPFTSSTGNAAGSATGPASGAAPGTGARQDRVRLLGDGGLRLAPVPGVARSLRVTAGVEVLRTAAGGLAVESEHSTQPPEYTVVSAPRPVLDEPGAAALLGGSDPARTGGSPSGAGPSGADPSGVALDGTDVAADRRWTQLPAGVPSRVLDLGGRLADGSGRFEAVRRIEDYVRGRAVYRLDSPVPAPGEDAVDDFLFRSRSGFCEQFASAEVVLLRAAGIPARLAVGFAGGTASGEVRTVRGSDAHAWVEVWFPGVGWVASDPTAGAVPASAPDGVLARWLAHVLPDGLVALLASRWGVAALSGLALVAGGLALWARRRRLLTAPTSRLPGAEPARRGAAELLAAFERLTGALAAAGTPRRREETLGELRERLAGDPRVVDALGVLERVLYSARPPQPGDLAGAAADLDSAAARILVAVREEARA